MGTYNFTEWIMRLCDWIKKKIWWLIAIILFLELPKLWGEDIVLTSFKYLFSIIWNYIEPQLIQFWITKPYLFELAIFLFALFVLILIAFIKTQPPKGIKIIWDVTDLGTLAQVVIKNFTGFKLTNCHLQINKVTGELYSTINPNLPLNCRFFENNEWGADKLIEIEHTGFKAFLLAATSIENDIVNFMTWDTSKNLRFKNDAKVTCKFLGTLPDGKTLDKDFEITLHIDNKQLRIVKVWQ